jgi:hypothetical protein
MEQSFSRDSNRSSARQEISRFFVKAACSLPHAQAPVTCPYPAEKIIACPRPCEVFGNIVRFYGKKFVALHPTTKLEDHPVSAVRDFLFIVFAATLLIWKPFLHLQREDAPYCGDRDLLIISSSALKH